MKVEKIEILKLPCPFCKSGHITFEKATPARYFEIEREYLVPGTIITEDHCKGRYIMNHDGDISCALCELTHEQIVEITEPWKIIINRIMKEKD